MADKDEIELQFHELDDEAFELHLLHHGVEEPDNFIGQDQLRKKGIPVLCGRLAESAHGYMTRPPDRTAPLNPTTNTESTENKNNKVPCTLAIFEWYIHNTSDSPHRIKYARIDMQFQAAASPSNQPHAPWVHDCAPWGTYSLFETDRTLETTKSWQPTLKLGQEGIANVDLPFVYDLKETVTRKEQIFVDGCPLPPKDGKYTHPDRFGAVQWNFFENKGQRSGIPKYFRTVVLLNRAESGVGRFTARTEIKVKVGWWEDGVERAKGFLGLSGQENDDDLTFNPMFLPKTERFRDEGVLADLGRRVKLDDEMGFLLFKGRAD